LSEPRVALVTARIAASDSETSRQLLAKGLTVVLAGRDEAAVNRARLTLPERDRGRAMTVRLDVTDSESIATAERTIRSRPVDSSATAAPLNGSERLRAVHVRPRTCCL